jgi:menaquinone-dependent protoporphyrinogen oxidase
MAEPILVTFATRYGATEEVAAAIAASLRDGGEPVTLRPMADVDDLGDVGPVVLGAPFYMGRWHRDATAFLVRHRDALAARPVAIFALGPIGTEHDPAESGIEELEHTLHGYTWLRPVATVMFGGRYDPARLSLADRVLAKLPVSPLHGMPANDLRDWDAIRAWATGLVPELAPVAMP